MKFNRLLKVADQYEKEIVKWTNNNQDIETIYDSLMDIIVEVKQTVNK